MLHAHVLKLGFSCDKYVRNAIRDMYAKYGPVEVARQVFNEMGETVRGRLWIGM